MSNKIFPNTASELSGVAEPLPCKPKLFNTDYCERCGGWIKGVDGPCPAVPPEKHWDESNEGHDIVPLQFHERVKS